MRRPATCHSVVHTTSSLSQGALRTDRRIEFDEVFSFVPKAIMQALRERFREPRHLDRVLCSSWAQTWLGWEQARRNLEENLEDPLVFEEAIKSCVHEFSVEVVSKVEMTAISDEERRAELVSDGKSIGQGLVYGSNACCADSLLQVLSRHGYFRKEVHGDTTADIDIRKSICEQARLHLMCHSDARLHPTLRDDLGRVVVATTLEHGKAYLEHDRHAAALVDFFVSVLGGARAIEPRGIR